MKPRIRTELGQGFVSRRRNYLPLLWDLQSPLHESKTVFLLSPTEIKEKCLYWDQQLPARWQHIEEEEQPLIDPHLRFSSSETIYSQQTLSVQQLQGDGLFFDIQPPKISISKIDALKEQLKEWIEQDWEMILVTPSTHQLRKIKKYPPRYSFSEMHTNKQVRTQTIQHTTGNLLKDMSTPFDNESYCVPTISFPPHHQKKKDPKTSYSAILYRLKIKTMLSIKFMVLVDSLNRQACSSTDIPLNASK